MANSESGSATAVNNSAYQAVKSNIEKIMSRLDIPAEKVTIKLAQTENTKFFFYLTYDYKAESHVNVVAGGKSTNNHYHIADYDSQVLVNYNYALNALNEKKIFVNQILKNPVGYFIEFGNYTVWDSGTFSFYYDCNACHGRGQDTCYSCYGSGKQNCYHCNSTGRITTEEYDSGLQRSVTVSRLCYACHGTGRMQCGTCWGTGTVSCSACGGHGYFTKYFQATTVAYPQRKLFYSKGSVHGPQVINHLKDKNNKYICENFKLEFRKSSEGNRESDTFEFVAPAQMAVAQITVAGDDKTYTEVGVNNIPAIYFPPIFDSFFAPIARNYIIESYLGGAREKKRRAKNIYHELKNHSYWSRLMLFYGLSGNKTEADRRRKVTTEAREYCGNFISSEAANDIGEFVSHVMKRIAPHTSPYVWWLFYLATMFIEFFYCFRLFDGDLIQNRFSIYRHNWGAYNWLHGYVGPSVVGLFWFLLAALFMVGPVGAIFNWIVTKYRQREVKKYHRPDVLHSPHIKTLMIIIVGWYLVIAASFGYLVKSHFYPTIVKIAAWVDIRSKEQGLLDFYQHQIYPLIYAAIAYLGAVTRPWWIKFYGINRAPDFNSYHYGLFDLQWLLIGLVFFIPTIIAGLRGKNWFAYLLGNILFGPFVIPWFIILLNSFA